MLYSIPQQTTNRPRVEVRAERLRQPTDIRGVIFDMLVFRFNSLFRFPPFML